MALLYLLDLQELAYEYLPHYTRGWHVESDAQVYRAGQLRGDRLVAKLALGRVVRNGVQFFATY